MAQVLLTDIAKRFKDKTIFEHIDLTVAKGRTIAVKGRSGSGKSTLLNIIAGLEKPTSGEYFLDGEDMSQLNLNRLSEIRKHKIGYISQHSPVIPKLTALENIMVPFWFDKKRENSKIIQKQVERLGRLFEIHHLLNDRVEKLSGGEIQRVGIIRALIKDPELIVADEPTGALDDETALKILACLDELKVNGVSVIIATHSGMVAEKCDERYQLTNQGLIKEIQ
ncbi:ABC transporter ATP-binding protein [Paenibacillus chitinolyticus]|uniref:ABC transporter ATP-binding protein n=1 Tax=Paenibacillus chitinolyticus TaxID=79263 RepID=UPI00366D6CD9